MHGRLALLAPLLLLMSGCTAGRDPQSNPPPPQSILPPSLLVDASGRGTLQLYVHAKQGNVRYAFLNLSVENETIVERVASYSLEVELDSPRAHVEVEAVEGLVTYELSGRFGLNETEGGFELIVESFDGEGYSGRRVVAVPYEKLLERREERP